MAQFQCIVYELFHAFPIKIGHELQFGNNCKSLRSSTGIINLVQIAYTIGKVHGLVLISNKSFLNGCLEISARAFKEIFFFYNDDK